MLRIRSDAPRCQIDTNLTTVQNPQWQRPENDQRWPESVSSCQFRLASAQALACPRSSWICCSLGWVRSSLKVSWRCCPLKPLMFHFIHLHSIDSIHFDSLNSLHLHSSTVSVCTAQFHQVPYNCYAAVLAVPSKGLKGLYVLSFKLGFVEEVDHRWP